MFEWAAAYSNKLDAWLAGAGRTNAGTLMEAFRAARNNYGQVARDHLSLHD